MSTAFTWLTLQTAIEEHVVDDTSDFTDSIATIIGLGEDKCVKDLDFEMWYAIDTSKATVQGSNLLTLPSGTLKVGDIYYTSSGVKVPLLERTYSYCMDYDRAGAQVAPKYWAPYTETQIIVAGTPNAVYAVTQKNLARPVGLSVSVTTSWLSTNLGDMLLHACLSSAEAFLGADERIGVWEGKYQQNRAAALKQFANLVRRNYP